MRILLDILQCLIKRDPKLPWKLFFSLAERYDAPNEGYLSLKQLACNHCTWEGERGHVGLESDLNLQPGSAQMVVYEIATVDEAEMLGNCPRETIGVPGDHPGIWAILAPI